MKALIVFIICIFTFCVNIFADGVMPVGSGTEDDPYSIETLDNLLYLSTNSNLWVSGLYFKQTADIDASDTANWNDETGFSPIGICDADSVYEPFSGFYNGDDHTINNLYINHVETHSDGLFGNTFECTIQNLGLTNVSITGDNSVGALVGYNERSNINSVYSTGVISASDGYAGGLVGFNDNSTVSNSYSTSSVNAQYSSGGLVGRNNENSTIKFSYSSGEVTSSEYCGGIAGYNSLSTVNNCYSSSNITSSGDGVGGLVGKNYGSDILFCFSTGNVEGDNRVGGLTGLNDWSSLIKNCYSISCVSGSDIIGGFVGNNWASVVNCYSMGNVNGFYDTVGGLIADNNPNSEVIDSYWDFETSNQTTSAGGVGRSTLEMQTQSTYTNWDFIYTWQIESYINNGYPYILPGADGIELSGSGTEDDPYLIINLDNLQFLSENNFLWASGTYFSQTEDIDASDTVNWNEGAGFDPIGDYHMTINEPFSGIYNGNGHIIDSIYINRYLQTTTMGIGFFGCTNTCTIKNIGLTNVNITGNNYVGSLIGFNGFDSIAKNSFCTGSVTGIDDFIVGSLVGLNSGTLNNCYSMGITSGSEYIGGLVGNNYGNVSNCYSKGEVSGIETVGGLVGKNYASLTNCFSICNLSGSNDVGGLVGTTGDESYVLSSFWDIESSGTTTSDGGTGKTTAEMQELSTYTSMESTGLDNPWDFVGTPFDDINNDDFWAINTELNDGYPYLSWQESSTYIDEEEINPNTYTETTLCKNYPNPFNPLTTIKFFVEENDTAELSIYNLKGQLVKSYPVFNSGYHSAVWKGLDNHGNKISSGIYLYKLQSKTTNQVHKMLMLK